MMRPTKKDVKIRSFRPSDIEAATQILLDSPSAAAWSHTGYENLLAQPSVVALVCESAAAVVGFIVARQAADDAEILNLAVAPQSRRAGHATALLLAAQQHLQQQNVTRVFLEVRDSNTAAIAFYRKHGFVPSGCRKAYYSGPKEDALLMEKRLTVNRKY